jgi:GNAT superfamily N-acetyltransferase
LEITGFRVHLAEERPGEPAGAVLTWSDELGVGVYWLTVLPHFRCRGVGRALITTVLDEAGDRPVTLTAAAAGEPLYRSLGFHDLALATWWHLT